MFFKKREGGKIKKWEWILLLIILLVSIFGKIYYSRTRVVTVKIGGQEFTALLADTEAKRHKGWSGRDNMGKYGGMLFIFPTRAQFDYGIVMRDMKMALDIVWLDGDKIIDIKEYASPEWGKAEKDLTLYFPRLPFGRVLELPSGFCQKNGVKIGDTVDIK